MFLAVALIIPILLQQDLQLRLILSSTLKSIIEVRKFQNTAIFSLRLQLSLFGLLGCYLLKEIGHLLKIRGVLY